eukprot:72881-Chlamydomonas_euryale.AAC.1
MYTAALHVPLCSATFDAPALPTPCLQRSTAAPLWPWCSPCARPFRPTGSDLAHSVRPGPHLTWSDVG